MVQDLFGRYGTLLAQPYMETAQGEYRIVVADGRPGYQLLKVPAPGQFKCNLTFGATIEAVDAPPEVLDLAVRACQAMGLTLGGADILPTPDGPVVLEVNEVPGKLGFVGEETGSRSSTRCTGRWSGGRRRSRRHGADQPSSVRFFRPLQSSAVARKRPNSSASVRGVQPAA